MEVDFIPEAWEHVFVTYPAYIRMKARQMRVERQLTIDEIAERLAISRTTIFSWVKDLQIPTTKATTLAAQRASEVTREKHRLLREDAYQRGVEEFEMLSSDPTFRDFLCMYIGEGSKRDRNSVEIANSDPAVIALGTRWLRQLSDRKVFFSVAYHADQDLDELRHFWSHLVGVELGAIKVVRKSNSNQLTGRTWRSEHGVLSVRTSDTYLRARLQAWMDLLRGEWNSSWQFPA